MRLSWEEVKYLVSCTGMQDHPHQLRYLATRDALHSQGATADTEDLELQFCGETGHASETIGRLLAEKKRRGFMRMSWEEVKYLTDCTGMQEYPRYLEYLASQDALHSAGKITDKDFEWLISGETGQGTATIARLLHEKRMNVIRGGNPMKITIVKVNRSVKEESISYCCGQMQIAIDSGIMRRPITSAEIPAVLLGTQIVNFCPFCGAKVEVVVKQ